MRAILPYYGWKICFFILGIQNFHHALCSATSTDWLLGEASIKLECPGNVWFELQIGNVPHGQEKLAYLYGLFLEVQYYPLVLQGLLVNYEVIHWCLVLYNIWLKVDLLAGGVLHKRDFNVTHIICDEGAIGSAPPLRDNPLCNRYVISGPFLYKNEIPT